MITIPPAWIFTGLVVAAAGAYAWHCEGAKEELAKAAGIAQEQARAAEAAADRHQKAKERSDANYRRRIAGLDAERKRLRDTRPGLLPAPTPGSGGAERITFDRGELERALRAFTEGAEGLVGEGEAAVIGLDEAKIWAQTTGP